MTNTYQADILGDGYEQRIFNFPNDYEGRVVSTLVRKKSANPTRKAVLYVHGFLDYFFQTEMAEQFNQHGFDFYAIDLRKYGRSKLPHQIFYNVLNLKEYNADLDQALKIIEEENHDAVLLAGHSTGGLTTTLYAAHHPKHHLIKALWVNSPFYDFNLSFIERKLGIPVLSMIGKVLPKAKFPSKLNRWYVPSLHRQFYGEWEFNLDWKPKSASTVQLSFIHAIHEAQKRIHRGLRLNIPVLVMHSHQTKRPRRWGKDAMESDVILNVKDIQRNGQRIQGDVTIQSIRNGLHDLVLSRKPVRDQVYQQLFQWLNRAMP